MLSRTQAQGTSHRACNCLSRECQEKKWGFLQFLLVASYCVIRKCRTSLSYSEDTFLDVVKEVSQRKWGNTKSFISSKEGEPRKRFMSTTTNAQHRSPRSRAVDTQCRLQRFRGLFCFQSTWLWISPTLWGAGKSPSAEIVPSTLS